MYLFIFLMPFMAIKLCKGNDFWRFCHHFARFLIFIHKKGAEINTFSVTTVGPHIA